MAAPWLAIVLKSVPWGEVIRRAPDIADGARRFWQAASGKQPQQATPVYEVPYEELESREDREARIQALENQVEALHRQMQESSALIKSLADQNAQLVAKVEHNRQRLGRLTRITVMLSVVILGLAFWLWRLSGAG